MSEHETSIQIRKYQSGDVDAIYDAVIESRVELSRWMPWCHAAYSREETAGWVESRPDAWENDGEWSFVIVDGDGGFLGACGIHRIDRLNGVGEVGYWVRTSATRQGIATEAVRLLCRWAFRETTLHRLEIVASIENLASQRVAEKAGATREGVLKERLMLHGRRHDGVLSAILKD
jgi:ribosomal-protein-serine acetyltransferase